VNERMVYRMKEFSRRKYYCFVLKNNNVLVEFILKNKIGFE
jgi:hypothetical protein